MTNTDLFRGVSGHNKVIDYFCEQYKANLETEYHMTRGKDGKHVKDLLAFYGYDMVIKMIDVFFATNSKYYDEEAGRSLGVFYTDRNKIAMKVRKEPRPVRFPTKEEKRMAYEAYCRKFGLEPDTSIDYEVWQVERGMA